MLLLNNKNTIQIYVNQVVDNQKVIESLRKQIKNHQNVLEYLKSQMDTINEDLCKMRIEHIKLEEKKSTIKKEEIKLEKEIKDKHKEYIFNEELKIFEDLVNSHTNNEVCKSLKEIYKKLIKNFKNGDKDSAEYIKYFKLLVKKLFLLDVLY